MSLTPAYDQQSDPLTSAFAPLAKSSRLAVSSTTANIALSVPINPIANQNLLVMALQVANETTGWIYLNFGTSNSVTASAGTAGSSLTDYPVAPGAVVVVQPPIGTTFVAGISDSATGAVILTPGIGL